MARYVILEHQTPPDAPRGRHWDFMIERDGVLRTWVLPSPPSDGASLEAESLADHRLDYLDYEGPISGGRGSVRRWDAGQYTLREETNGRIVVDLVGVRLAGAVELSRDDADQRWRLRFFARSPGGRASDCGAL